MTELSLIFAPGAWYPPTAFDSIITQLRQHGHISHCQTIAFPSIQQATTVKDLQPDIEATRALVEPEADAGRDVVLVVHSWVGLPVNSALGGHYWASTLRPHAWATKVSPATDAAYLTIPSTYLLCEEDRAIPIAVQEAMVEKARGSGAPMKTERIKAAHTPWLARPEEVLRFLQTEIGRKRQ